GGRRWSRYWITLRYRQRHQHQRRPTRTVMVTVTVQIAWDKATELVKNAKRVIVVTHVSPDGDAIGTLLGLGHALQEQHKTVALAVDEGVLPSLAFLPGSDLIRDSVEGVEADLLIAVDCGDESRMGNVGKQARQLKTPAINLDHHWSNTDFGDVNLVNSEWVS